MRRGTDPLVHQYVTGLSDSPVRFHYPGQSTEEDFGLGASAVPQFQQRGEAPCAGTSQPMSLHRQAECKTANPSDLHAAESCFPGDVHVRPFLGFLLSLKMSNVDNNIDIMMSHLLPNPDSVRAQVWRNFL